MSLKTETKDKLKALGFDVDKLIAAVTHADEQDYELPTINNLSDADLATRDENSKKEGTKEGKKNGIAIATKAIADKFGITDAVASPDDLVVKLNANFSKGDEGLKEQVKLLQADKAAAIADKEKAVSEVKTALFDRDLITKFPANRTKLMNDAELLSLVKGNLTFEESEGVTIAKRNGEVVRDPVTKSPLAIDKVVEDLFAERKWVEGDGGNNGGRGGGDHSNNGAGGKKKLSQVIDAWESEGKNPMSPEFQTHLSAIVKATTDFDMNG